MYPGIKEPGKISFILWSSIWKKNRKCADLNKQNYMINIFHGKLFLWDSHISSLVSENLTERSDKYMFSGTDQN